MVAAGADSDRVIQRVITRSAVSSAQLKVSHRELAAVGEMGVPINVGSWRVWCVIQHESCPVGTTRYRGTSASAARGIPLSGRGRGTIAVWIAGRPRPCCACWLTPSFALPWARATGEPGRVEGARAGNGRRPAGWAQLAGAAEVAAGLGGGSARREGPGWLPAPWPLPVPSVTTLRPRRWTISMARWLPGASPRQGPCRASLDVRRIGSA
jgi:hypothetical protein